LGGMRLLVLFGAIALAQGASIPHASGAAQPPLRRTLTAAATAFGPVQRLRGGSDKMKEELSAARKEIWDLCEEKNCNPVLVRLGWHDAGTHDVNIKEWPKCGGAIGSIRFKPEIEHGANAGLAGVVKMLEPIKDKYKSVSWADLFQMGGAVAIEHAGGPKIAMRYGRVDGPDAAACSPQGNLPDAEPNDKGVYGGAGGTASTEAKEPGDHLRKVFYRMGMNDKEIVALSGAHTLGRAWKDRSGLGADKTKFTDGSATVRNDGKAGCGKAGGSSWTEKWLKFDNSYFKVVADDKADKELLKLSTDKVLFVDEGFKKYAEKYRDDEKAFFDDYAAAHKKLSECGAKFEPEGGIVLD